MITLRKKLRPITLDGGTIDRSLFTVGREPVVLFEKSHPMLAPKYTPAEWSQVSVRNRVGPSTRKFVQSWNQHDPFAFNCHTLAIGSFLGLQPTYWLEGSRSVFTLMENPAQTLLDAFFHELDRTRTLSSISEHARQNDVLVLRHTETGELAHSGVIRIEDGRLLVISKLGEHPVSVSTPAALEEEYQGQYDSVHLLCCKPETIRRPRRHRGPLRVLHGSTSWRVDMSQDLRDRTVKRGRNFAAHVRRGK